jgi:hypothetical protein
MSACNQVLRSEAPPGMHSTTVNSAHLRPSTTTAFPVADRGQPVVRANQSASLDYCHLQTHRVARARVQVGPRAVCSTTLLARTVAATASWCGGLGGWHRLV